MVPRQTGHVGCSSPASGVLDEKGIIGVSPGFPVIGGLECWSGFAVNESVYCSAENRYGNATLDAPCGPVATAIMVSNNDGRHIDPAVSRGGVIARFKTKQPAPGTQRSFVPLLATDPRPVRVAAVGARKIRIKVEIV